MTFQADVRAAAVELLEDYATSADVKLHVFRARPKSIQPPCAFVDSMSEERSLFGPTNVQRTVRVQVIVLWGLFDSGEAVDQRDVFVDGFLAWVDERYHAAGGSTLIAGVAVQDEPAFVSDWQPSDVRRTYYASQITLEGFATV